jgi:hypothetical protein
MSPTLNDVVRIDSVESKIDSLSLGQIVNEGHLRNRSGRGKLDEPDDAHHDTTRNVQRPCGIRWDHHGHQSHSAHMIGNTGDDL